MLPTLPVFGAHESTFNASLLLVWPIRPACTQELAGTAILACASMLHFASASPVSTCFAARDICLPVPCVFHPCCLAVCHSTLLVREGRYMQAAAGDSLGTSSGMPDILQRKVLSLIFLRLDRLVHSRVFKTYPLNLICHLSP